jgi:hypothetical protein
MKCKTALVSAAALIVLAAVPGSPSVSVARASGCEAGVRIDRTTVGDAKKKIEAAGYRQVRDLKKGCDNVWHATAVKDGNDVHVAVTPHGEVLPEGD